MSRSSFESDPAATKWIDAIIHRHKTTLSIRLVVGQFMMLRELPAFPATRQADYWSARVWSDLIVNVLGIENVTYALCLYCEGQWPGRTTMSETNPLVVMLLTLVHHL